MKVGKPSITDLKEGATDFTRITWTPDLAKFGLTELDADHCALFERRAYDLCARARPIARMPQARPEGMRSPMGARPDAPRRGAHRNGRARAGVARMRGWAGVSAAWEATVNATGPAPTHHMTSALACAVLQAGVRTPACSRHRPSYLIYPLRAHVPAFTTLFADAMVAGR